MVCLNNFGSQRFSSTFHTFVTYNKKEVLLVTTNILEHKVVTKSNPDQISFIKKNLCI